MFRDFLCDAAGLVLAIPSPPESKLSATTTPASLLRPFLGGD
jgi:hypothetical protein